MNDLLPPFTFPPSAAWRTAVGRADWLRSSVYFRSPARRCASAAPPIAPPPYCTSHWHIITKQCEVTVDTHFYLVLCFLFFFVFMLSFLKLKYRPLVHFAPVPPRHYRSLSGSSCVQFPSFSGNKQTCLRVGGTCWYTGTKKVNI